jgi:hypothetical protein
MPIAPADPWRIRWRQLVSRIPIGLYSQYQLRREDGFQLRQAGDGRAIAGLWVDRAGVNCKQSRAVAREATRQQRAVCLSPVRAVAVAVDEPGPAMAKCEPRIQCPRNFVARARSGSRAVAVRGRAGHSLVVARRLQARHLAVTRGEIDGGGL